MQRATHNATEVAALKVADEIIMSDSWLPQSRARYRNTSWHDWRSRCLPPSRKRHCGEHLLLSMAPDQKLALR